ncbi:hypothetical protein D3C86_1596570 [compost metagenome]
MHVYFKKAVKLDKALFIGTSDHDIQVFHRIVDRNAFLHRQVIIDLQLILGIIGSEEGEQTCQLFAFTQFIHKCFVDLVEILVIRSGVFIQQTQGESA